MSDFLKKQSKKIIVAIIVTILTFTGLQINSVLIAASTDIVMTPNVIESGKTRTSGQVKAGTELTFNITCPRGIVQMQYQWNRNLKNNVSELKLLYGNGIERFKKLYIKSESSR